MIEGRVLNARNGEYVAGARITVEGTVLETLTDSDGFFRLARVPAGGARVTAFYTGLPPQTTEVTVSANQSARLDVTMGGAGKSTAGAIVKLDAFQVETSREMDASALAINEQRFASNIKNVLSTEEFGNVSEGNVAEFLKFLPGVTIDYTGGNARDISINGVPSDNVPVTLDGFSIASAPGNATGRSVASDMISINNLSRIEVSYSPTPESQGSALAGSVNMVPRSSFERAKPLLNTSLYVIMRDNARDFNKVPGPKPSATRNVHPGFDFSYVAPVNKRFGYTLSAGTSTNYSPQDNSQNTQWRGVGTTTNGTTLPHTTPANPYLTAYQVQDAPKVTTRRSIGASIDYKFTPHDRVTFGFQYSSFDGQYIVSSVNFNVGTVRPGDFTTTSTQGAVGTGVLQSVHQERNRFNRTRMPTVVWRHDGPVWKADGGFGYSLQDDGNPDTQQGYFRNATMQRSNVTIALKDIFYLRPNEITVRDGPTGAAVDPFALSTYSLVSTTSQVDTNIDRQKSAYGSLRRDFYARIPFTLKTGFDFRQTIRDNRGGTQTSNFVGPDGRGSTVPLGNDDSPVRFFDPIYSQRILPFGFPRLETPSNRKIYEHSVANPSHFTQNQNTVYRNLVGASRHSEEIISSLYLRGDVNLLQNRLKLVGGLRAEQTNAQGEGALTDPTRNYQRGANGQILRNPNGTPVLILPTSNALGVSQLTFIDRGAHTKKEYLRYFPSINASYNLRENLIARAAYYHSVGRPNFIQYSGGITLPDTGNPPADNNRISVNNSGIKAWSARTVNVRLERYFEGVGQFSIGAFRREIEDFFGATVLRPTPEFLALYSLDPTIFGDYDVSTRHNVAGTVRTEGWDFNYKQALTFLPPWARGVQVFANGSAQRVTGDDTVSFAGFIPRSGSWGISLTRQKYNLRLNWNYRGRSRNNLITGTGIEPGTFNWTSKRLYMDVVGEYKLWKQTAFFFNLRNVGDATEDTKIFGPNTPEVARFRTRVDYASLWTFGVKGTW
ncbi:MAG: carboxypeptidase regulatory-like domain-containing protein [Opitutaceae bacterium]|nr:carboxypeptidase regulatory-like domain-containing protein [Opitutaceae bacterium]